MVLDSTQTILYIRCPFLAPVSQLRYKAKLSDLNIIPHSTWHEDLRHTLDFTNKWLHSKSLSSYDSLKYSVMASREIFNLF